MFCTTLSLISSHLRYLQIFSKSPKWHCKNSFVLHYDNQCCTKYYLILQFKCVDSFYIWIDSIHERITYIYFIFGGTESRVVTFLWMKYVHTLWLLLHCALTPTGMAWSCFWSPDKCEYVDVSTSYTYSCKKGDM